jgi:hypothetical protein
MTEPTGEDIVQEEDTRVRVPLGGKQIDLAQLTEEIGVGLTADDTHVVVADPDDDHITVEQLAAALDAHDPPAPVDPLTDDEIRALRAMLERTPDA